LSDSHPEKLNDLASLRSFLETQEKNT